MLVIEVKENEKVTIGEAVLYVAHAGKKFRLEIDAPRHVQVERGNAKAKGPKPPTE